VTNGETATNGETVTEGRVPPASVPGRPAPGNPERAIDRRCLAVLGASGLAALALDVLTKQLAVGALEGRPPVRLFGGALYLVLFRNSGAAFSLGQSYTLLFPIFTLAAVAWIGWMARGLRSVSWAAALGLVLGGALGNLGDRLFRSPGPFVGHVVDFLSLFNDAGQVWPVFNVADSALCVGLAIALLLEVTGRRRDGTRADSAKPTPPQTNG
jgi:signal peptidase II